MQHFSNQNSGFKTAPEPALCGMFEYTVRVAAYMNSWAIFISGIHSNLSGTSKPTCAPDGLG